MNKYVEEYLSDPDGSKLDEELSGYKPEKAAIDKEIEVGKNGFAEQLRRGLGATIENELRHPRRMNFFTGLKYKILRYLTIRKDKKRSKAI